MHEAHIRVPPLPRVPSFQGSPADRAQSPPPNASNVAVTSSAAAATCGGPGFLRDPVRPWVASAGRECGGKSRKPGGRTGRARQELRSHQNGRRWRKNRALLVTGPRLLWKRTPRPSVWRLPRSWLARALASGAIPAMIGRSERAWPAGSFVSALVSLVRRFKAFALRKSIALCVVPESLNCCHPGGEERSVPCLLTLDRKCPLCFCFSAGEIWKRPR